MARLRAPAQPLAAWVFCALWQLAAGNASILFPFGPNTTDVALHRGDDACYGPVTLAAPATMYGKTYSSLYVSINGVLSMQACISTYTPQRFPIAGATVMAPFWADVDTRLLDASYLPAVLPGDPAAEPDNVFWRSVSGPAMLADPAYPAILATLAAQYPVGQPPPTGFFIATWWRVRAYSACACGGTDGNYACSTIVNNPVYCCQLCADTGNTAIPPTSSAYAK